MNSISNEKLKKEIEVLKSEVKELESRIVTIVGNSKMTVVKDKIVFEVSK